MPLISFATGQVGGDLPIGKAAMRVEIIGAGAIGGLLATPTIDGVLALVSERARHTVPR